MKVPSPIRRLFPAAMLLAWAQITFAENAAVEPNRRHRPGGTRPIEAAVNRLPLSSLHNQMAPELEALPAGVHELRFSDFYSMPVGPRGLEMSENIKLLAGKTVRLVGFFVFEDWTTCGCPEEPSPAPARKSRRPAAPAWMKHVVPGRAMISAVPTSVSLGHYGLGDELPPQTAFVHIASRFGEPVAFKPGLYSVTGKLEIGNKVEMDGRISFVRLAVDSDEQIKALAPVARHASR